MDCTAVKDMMREATRVGYRLHIDGAFGLGYATTVFINLTLLFCWFLEKLFEQDIRTIDLCREEEGWAINCPAPCPGRLLMLPS